jgi:hypothetical protein
MAHLRRAEASLLGVTFLLGAVACSASNADDERADHPPLGARCPVVTRAGGCRAASPKEVVTIASGGFLLPAAGFPLGNGGFLAFSVNWSDERILSIRSDRPWGFDAADTLPWDAANGATGVTTRGKHVLYFVARTPATPTPSLHAVALEDAVLDAPTPVVLDGASLTPSWPQAVGLSDGRVLLAFVVPQRQVFIGVDDGTGMRFSVSGVDLPEPDLSGVLAHVGTTARGSWVLTYQVADSSWRFRSHVLLSRDEGRSWSDPKAGRLGGDEDVSHAFPIARTDEGADVYYVKQEIVWRRALHEDGTLGSEQAVTSSDVGSAAYPQPRRLPNGRIALMLALERSSTAKDLAVVALDGDAP